MQYPEDQMEPGAEKRRLQSKRAGRPGEGFVDIRVQEDPTSLVNDELCGARGDDEIKKNRIYEAYLIAEVLRLRCPL